MNVVVDSGGRYIKPAKGAGIRLTTDALNLLKTKDGVSRFLQACGDSFVTTVRLGGRMTALLSISKVDQSQKEEIKAQAAASFGGFGGSASFNQTIAKAAAENALNVTFEQVGGAFSGIPVSYEDFLTKFSQYKVDDTYTPRPYVFFTQNYRTLPNWPDGLENRVSPVDQEFFVQSYGNFKDLVSDYDRAIKNSKDYLNFLKGGPDEISTNRDTALIYARNLDLAIWECINSFDCSTTNLDRLDTEFQAQSTNKDAAQIDAATRFNPTGKETGLSSGSFSGFVKVVPEGEAEASTPGVANEGTAPQGSSASYLPKMTVSYYTMLGSLPLYSNKGVTGFSVALDPSGNPPPDDEILRAFGQWLIAARLRPVSESYCRRAARHPLCLSGQDMREIIKLIHIAPESIRPNPVPPVQPKPEPEKPVVVKPVAPRDPIQRGACRFNPSICI